MDFLVMSSLYRIVAFADDAAMADTIAREYVSTRPGVSVTIYEPTNTITNEVTKTEEVKVVDEKAAKVQAAADAALEQLNQPKGP